MEEQLQKKLNIETKAQQTGCCLFFFPPLWPLLIIISPILWLIHAVEKRVAIRKIKRDYENNLENLKKAAEEEKKLAKYHKEKERLEKKRNPYYPFKTREEHLAHKEEELRKKKERREEREKRLAKEKEERREEREAYLANKEEELRKKEKNKYLAEAYKQRSRTKDFRSNLEKVDNLINLSPIEFEKWVKIQIFESNGWVVEGTKASGDGGIDLILIKENERSIAQCKRFRGTIGEPMLRDFYGAMMSEGVSRGFFITTGVYSLSALKFAENKPIEMIDRRVIATKFCKSTPSS